MLKLGLAIIKGYIRIIDKKMETMTWGFRFRGPKHERATGTAEGLQ